MRLFFTRFSILVKPTIFRVANLCDVFWICNASFVYQGPGPCQWLTQSNNNEMNENFIWGTYIVISCCIDRKNDLIIRIGEHWVCMCNVQSANINLQSRVRFIFDFFSTVIFVERVSWKAVSRHIYDSFYSMHFLSDPIINSEWRTYNTYWIDESHLSGNESNATYAGSIRYSLNDWMFYVSWHQQKNEERRMETNDIRMRITTIQKNKHVKNEIIRNDFMSKSNLMWHRLISVVRVR